MQQPFWMSYLCKLKMIAIREGLIGISVTLFDRASTDRICANVYLAVIVAFCDLDGASTFGQNAHPVLGGYIDNVAGLDVAGIGVFCTSTWAVVVINIFSKISGIGAAALRRPRG